MQRRRSARLGVTIGVALGAVVAFAAIGGTGLAGGLAKPAKPQSGLGQYQYGAKVTICHKGKVTIRISINALKAHQRRHGDTMGPCAAARAAKAAKLKAAKVKAVKLKAAKAAKQARATGDTGAVRSLSRRAPGRRSRTSPTRQRPEAHLRRRSPPPRPRPETGTGRRRATTRAKSSK